MKLSKDLREFVELLNSRKIKYVLVGGHAVAFHGFPRFTGDVDFLSTHFGCISGAVMACACLSTPCAE
jgi:hypothetical protein